ncbi:MAG: acyl carrier protein [Candidatus Aureabacteria bacterium]|nr:acyl carrier protein [Candidatus Auribacterota bacterium]NLW95024.1 acyl carrier protein [Chlamydiota bacterium]HOE26386.1 acyl carrier protein [bacterium]
MVDKSQVYGKIKECLVEALGVEEAEIVPGARIMDDLGAESIDFLDIVFRLEKAFGIKIPRGGLFPENILSNDQFVKDGKVTARGIEELRKRMPCANLASFEKDPRVSNFSNLFTVEMINRYVESMLG